MPPREAVVEERFSRSGIPLELYYGPEHWSGSLEPPGEYPFTRGIHRDMYRGKLWTMRQYAGYGTAEETNARFRYLLEHGQTGLSVAFDLPTQMGLDSDDPRAEGEVGKVGVAIDSLEDMRILFAGIPLDRVSTSMTINAPAALLLALYELVAEEQGVPAEALTGTVQNDILKEYVARGTYIFPPGPSLRLVVDVMEYCATRMPRFNTISVSGYHMAEKGATAVQEVAFTLANAACYLQAALERGLDVDRVAPRMSFFFVARESLFEEVAKFRAARRIWARTVRERFGAKDPRSWTLRFHTQTAGVELTAAQPEVNLVRVTVQALAAILGGTQSLHCNAYDEALALPTEKAARLALRTQQVLAYETGVADVVDPLGGSWYVERLTDEVEAQAWAYLEKIEAMGGALAAVESGFMAREIEQAAYEEARAVEEGRRKVVGVNAFTEGGEEGVEILRIPPRLEEEQKARLREVRAKRDQRAVEESLGRLEEAARGGENLVPPIKEALRCLATLGEVCSTLKKVFGEYRPSRDF